MTVVVAQSRARGREVSKEFVCPNCHIVVDDDSLVVTTRPSKPPHCRFTLRKQEGFRWQDRAAVVAATSRQFANGSLRWRDGVNAGLDLDRAKSTMKTNCKAIVAGNGQKPTRWPAPTLAARWSTTQASSVLHSAADAERVSKTEMPEENLLASVCALGVQPHGSIQDSWSAWEAHARGCSGERCSTCPPPPGLESALFVAVRRPMRRWVKPPVGCL
jgi:hypothetical protein